jgi:hypothetical protein
MVMTLEKKFCCTKKIMCLILTMRPAENNDEYLVLSLSTKRY